MLRQIRAPINPATKTKKSRLSRLQLVRRPNNVRLLHKKQAGERTRLKNHALTLLTRHHHTNTLRHETPVKPLTKHLFDDISLPVIKAQPSRFTERYRVLAKISESRLRDVLNSRLLRPENGAG